MGYVIATDGNFTEKGYLTANPDVAAAVKAGAFQSGLAHFRSHGRKERRRLIAKEQATVAAIYEAMRRTPMHLWVGGGDPEITGLDCYEALQHLAPIMQGQRVLDYGCGIGRTAVHVASCVPDVTLVGVDIVPSMIEFCHTHIAKVLANTTFYCIEDENPHYDRFLPSEPFGRVSLETFVAEHRGSFDLVYAYSVFTHFDPSMTERYLQTLGQLLSSSGKIMLTCFLNAPSNPATKRLPLGSHFLDSEPNDPLRFAVYDLGYLTDLMYANGLRLTSAMFGHWRGYGQAGASCHYQDALVLEKLAAN